jgi:hypothetical protein
MGAQFKGVDMMASATIDADYRAGGNSTAINSTITLEFEVNAWPFERENYTAGALSGAAGTTAGALGESDYHKQQRAKAKAKKRGDDGIEYHMTLSGEAIAGHSCDAPTAEGVIGAPRKAEITLMLRDLYGVDVNARGSLIMYCENGESPDGQNVDSHHRGRRRGHRRQ